MRITINRAIWAFTVGCVASLAASNTSWGALTQIKVTAGSSVSIASKAYNNGAVVAGSSSWAGMWNAKIVSGNVPAGYTASTTWSAFCTDLGNANNNGTYSFEARPFTAAAADNGPNADNNGTAPDPKWANVLSGNRAAWVYNQHVGDLTSTYNPAGDNFNHTYTANEKAGAMALSIWELLYEDNTDNQGYNVLQANTTSTGGRSFKVTSSIDLDLNPNDSKNSASWAAILANYWLGDFVAHGNTFIGTTWWAEQATPDVQSLLGPKTLTMVPEPTTCVAGVLLLLPFLANAVRARQKNPPR